MHPAGSGEFGHVQRRGLVLIGREERGARLGMQMKISRQHPALRTCIITPDIKECNQNRFHQAPFPHLTHRLALNQFPNIFLQIVSHV
jgi:hypothetical protein